MRRRPFYAIAALCVLGAVAAVVATYRVSLDPLALHPRAVQFAVAKADLLVDTPVSQLVANGNEWVFGPSQEAINYALYLKSDAAAASAARAAGIPGREISVSGPFSYDLGPPPKVPPRTTEIPRALPIDNNYRLVVDVSQFRPMLTLYGQAPTERAATAIVNSMRTLLTREVASLEVGSTVPLAFRAVIRPLGPTTGGVVDPSGRLQLLATVFICVLLLGGTVVVASERRRRRAVSPTDSLRPLQGRLLDDWPRTTRLLPWSIALFVVILFLVPIDALSLPFNVPLDSKPDRVVLILIAMLWLAALAAAEGGARPHIRFSGAHVAAFMFLGLCCVGVALNGHDLANSDEVVPVLKKLVLLASFVLFFVIAASVLRPTEVPRFISLILGLAVVVAIGAIVERQTQYNIFYSVWQGVLPLDPPTELDQIDTIGRLFVAGPTNQPLELAALLAMVFPLAIVRALGAPGWRRRSMYLFVAALLLAGGISTYRKTSVIGPAAALIVLTAYRPRPMLRGLAVSAVPLLLVVHLLVPGQIGSLWQELLPGNVTSVGTTTHRVARYDAIRPDVMNHLLLGRGYESYDPYKYRVLDNEYLGLLIGVGAVGLLVFLAIFVAFLAAARPLIRGPDPVRAEAALGAYGAIVVALVSSFLFDALAFTHVSYLSLFMGALILGLREAHPAERRLPARLRSGLPVDLAGAGAGA